MLLLLLPPRKNASCLLWSPQHLQALIASSRIFTHLLLTRHTLLPFDHPQALPEAAAETGTAAALASGRAPPPQLRARLSAAARCVHESPSNARLWYMAALVAKKAAAVEGEEAAGVRAWRWCRAAEGAALSAAASAAAAAT